MPVHDSRVMPLLGACCILGGMALPASAQNVPATTILHLSANASVQVAPDLLVADLTANGASALPAAAQRRVNGLMADAMKMAQGVAGIDARATGYSVNSTNDKQSNWVAQQTLELRGSDGPALLDLAGRLQQHGLILAALDWQLSPALRRKAHDEATTQALKEIQTRAASAAATLGLHVDHLQDVRLDGPAFEPRPMMAMAKMSMPSPQATAAPEDVGADVTAEMLLRP